MMIHRLATVAVFVAEATACSALRKQTSWTLHRNAPTQLSVTLLCRRLPQELRHERGASGGAARVRGVPRGCHRAPGRGAAAVGRNLAHFALGADLKLAPSHCHESRTTIWMGFRAMASPTCRTTICRQQMQRGRSRARLPQPREEPLQPRGGTAGTTSATLRRRRPCGKRSSCWRLGIKELPPQRWRRCRPGSSSCCQWRADFPAAARTNV